MTNKLTNILLTAIIVFAVGCNNAPAPETDSGKTEAADKAKATEITEDEVKTALELLRASVEKNDSEAMDKIYADDYVLVNPEGKAETRAERMEIVKAGKIKYEKVDFNDPKIRIYGNTAVNKMVVSLLVIIFSFIGVCS